MLGISAVEFAVVGVVALLAVGPKQLPDVFRALGKIYRRVNRLITLYRTTLDDALYDSEALAQKAEKMLNKKDENNDGTV